jgi:hypothetical protein
MHYGGCLCGAVRFSVAGELGAPNACHCQMCRRVSGHYFASTEVKKRDLTLEQAEALRWYASSAKVRRGFCGICGSSLFWDPPGRNWIAVAMGAFDGPTGVAMNLHIFVGEKGDYYEIADGLPQNLA